MSINLSQNQEMLKQQGSFGAAPIETPANIGIYQLMGIPTNRKELLEQAPYFATALAASKLISDSAVHVSTLNPLKKGVGAITLADTYNKSRINRLCDKVDKIIYPFVNKHAGRWNAIKTTVGKYTPDWVKNAIEKIKIGVRPINKMALVQYRGCTAQAADAFLGSLREVPTTFWKSIGVDGIPDILKGLNGTKKSALDAIGLISDKLKNVSAKDLAKVKLASGKSFKLINELNKVKAFMGLGSKTAVTKYGKKLTMAVSEAAGGGVIGASWLGLVMNSLFLANTIKRTWKAPKGEKFKTFMEGALVEFCGAYLMMLLGTRLTYKLLGLKNIDKTAAQIKGITGLTNGVNTLSKRYKDAVKLQKLMKHGEKAEGIFSKLFRKFRGIDFNTHLKNRTAAVIGKVGKYKNLPSANAIDDIVKTYPSIINKSIDKLKAMKKFQKNGHGFFRNLFNRPIRWIGNFLSTGLENLPVKVGTKGFGKFASGWRSFANIFKSCLGYPLRFALVLLVVTPPLTNLLAKISHTCFGKPKNSIMDGDKKEENKSNQQQGQTPQLDKMQAFSELTKQIGQLREAQQPTVLPPGYDFQMSKTLVDGAVNAQRNRLEHKDRIDISPATYVPSPMSSNPIDPDMLNAVQQKLARSYKAEKFAQTELEDVKNLEKF